MTHTPTAAARTLPDGSASRTGELSSRILRLLQEEAMTAFPAFPGAFGQLLPRAVEALPSPLETDGAFLYYQPQTLCRCFLTSPGELRRIYLHIHLHCLCLHTVARPALSARQVHLWDMACDLSVSWLAAQLTGSGQRDAAPDFDRYRLTSAQWMDTPSLLTALAASEALRQLAGSCALDVHCFWREKPRSSRDDSARASADGSPSCASHLALSADEFRSFLRRWSPYRKRLAEAAAQGSGKRGLQSGTGSERPVLQRRNAIDYRRFLYRFTVPGEEPILDMDSFDYIPYHYGMHLPAEAAGGHTPLLLEPLEYKEVNRLDELAIAIDTSGSCSGRIVRRFLEETWAILRQRDNFFSRMRLHLIQCDSMVQEHRIFTSAAQWEAAIPEYRVLGQGDTDFCPVFTYLDRLLAKKEIRRLRGLLYFSDGDGIYPDRRPKYETAFVFLREPDADLRIPDWVIRLNLNLPEDF